MSRNHLNPYRSPTPQASTSWCSRTRRSRFPRPGCAHVSRVRERIRRSQDYPVRAVSSDWICYALIDDIIDIFTPYMRATEQTADLIEDQVLIARGDDIKALIPHPSSRKSTTSARASRSSPAGSAGNTTC
ncbi:hypothetical protein BO70DRAFT_361380 [Aspergillus heteromorphus CBS 117.55]|uniref:Uncharacterized protein n=1 Tax=Aspergillus heteromorphus CBS 117.55 TaxID=1448321 RepID=A0A317WFB8_9EURO|nr:uncharacterized protein BO70DRAFT_361380 [Aspergillus heteromorphus CBS 117.55]PWY84989.1 hypothetical protein BO70DRAFT_361380 [Aspergillus heteromorphus CBS 117.55]